MPRQPLSISDHQSVQSTLTCNLDLPNRSRPPAGLWKLNTSILSEEGFQKYEMAEADTFDWVAFQQLRKFSKSWEESTLKGYGIRSRSFEGPDVEEARMSILNGSWVAGVISDIQSIRQGCPYLSISSFYTLSLCLPQQPRKLSTSVLDVLSSPNLIATLQGQHHTCSKMKKYYLQEPLHQIKQLFASSILVQGNPMVHRKTYAIGSWRYQWESWGGLICWPRIWKETAALPSGSERPCSCSTSDFSYQDDAIGSNRNDQAMYT
ncbi:hypothetical protein OUZ56_018202 [Daphnia magna]|uniref:Uncharacterized protein n=1 Tax=Daphnia magna TaxID=35525 RepID=A0ABQ9Z8B9_9CRUS|nr:hypothetical protein OUZ56_018202 [Daphnia magna]